MGREFLTVFTDWASDYDEFVAGQDPEYAAVFENYDEILAQVVARSGTKVLEFGSGTGNLTKVLKAANKEVYPVEPSPEMRRIAEGKVELVDVTFLDGDLENFPDLPGKIDTIVSTFVFHHLSEGEKQRALNRYAELLPRQGKIVFGDTMFLSAEIYQHTIRRAEMRGQENLAADLAREYYPLVSDVAAYFSASGFSTKFTQMNDYAWIVEGTKM